MSRKFKKRVAELATREAEIKRSLLGKSKKCKSRVRRIKKNALYGGVLTLAFYLIYKSFRPDRERPVSSSRKTFNTKGMMTEKIILFMLNYLGKIVEGYLRGNFKKSKEIADSDN